MIGNGGTSACCRAARTGYGYCYNCGQRSDLYLAPYDPNASGEKDRQWLARWDAATAEEREYAIRLANPEAAS